MEKAGVLGDKQGGSRAGRMAQQVLLLKQAIYSIWRLSRTNGASFDNDAKSCYDRIVMLLASLASQRGGMTKEACNIFLATLDEMKYHVKTALEHSQREAPRIFREPNSVVITRFWAEKVTQASSTRIEYSKIFSVALCVGGRLAQIRPFWGH
jgi:hypothetical protein